MQKAVIALFLNDFYIQDDLYWHHLRQIIEKYSEM